MNLTTEQIEQILKGADKLGEWAACFDITYGGYMPFNNYSNISDLREILALRKRVKELEEQIPKWVSVEKRLPESNESVLSLDDKGRVYNSTYMGKYFKCVGLVWEHDNVTHWMPLPQPPKGER